ncbi:MAG: energy transducer TonB [Microscillaceae bacterium]|nr:energy transducer TonB [Microscillaceae bacterium]
MITVLLLVFWGTNAFLVAQPKMVPTTNSLVQNQETVYKITQLPPSPKGGMCAFFEYTEENLQRPKEAIEKGIRGNVFVRFVVEKDGRLSNIEVIKGIGGGCDEAVVKLLEKAPNWKPGVQNGVPVRVQKTLSIQVR